MSRVCPDDGTVLERRAYHGLILDVCPVCGGVYFDEGEMAALQSGGPAVLAEVDHASLPADLTLADCDDPKRCPGCRAPMCAYDYRYSSDIRLDGCERCGGIWVQDGELRRIADHLRFAPVSFGGVAASRRHLATLHAAAAHLSP